MSLQDMFNSPIAPPPRSPRASTPGTPTRAGNQQPLFFSPGSAAGTPVRPDAAAPHAGPSRPRARATTADIDLADIFAEDENDALPAVPPPLKAGGSGNNNGNGHAVRQENGIYRGYTQAGGDFAPLIDPFAGVRAIGGADGDDDEGGGKKRRIMAKVDADRLMEANGLPALMQKAKRFKVKGKGREAEDLANLMDVYQMWAHKMFPKGDFAHTIQRVEVMCRGRRMNSALKGYREAFYPPRKSPSPPARSRSVSPVRSEAEAGEDDSRRSRQNTRDRSNDAATPDRRTSGGEDMDVDAEAEEAMEEMMRLEAEAEAGQTGLPARDGRQADRAANQVAVGRDGHGTGEREGMEEPLFMPGEPDEEELAALLEMEGDM